MWNAASANFSADDAVSVLKKYARYEIPQSVIMWIKEISSRFGKIKLINAPNVHFPDDKEKIIYKRNEDGTEIAEKITEQYLFLVADALPIFKEINANHSVKKMLTLPPESVAPDAPEFSYILKLTDRGTIKQLLLQAGWPVKDEVPLCDGEMLDIHLKAKTSSGKTFEIREYQKKSAEAHNFFTF